MPPVHSVSGKAFRTNRTIPRERSQQWVLASRILSSFWRNKGIAGPISRLLSYCDTDFQYVRRENALYSCAKGGELYGASLPSGAANHRNLNYLSPKNSDLNFLTRAMIFVVNYCKIKIKKQAFHVKHHPASPIAARTNPPACWSRCLASSASSPARCITSAVLTCPPARSSNSAASA